MAKSKKPGGPKRAGYRVGYGKPSKHSQFKKGVSGNPRGRRTSSRNRSTLIGQASRGQTADETPRPISRGQATVLNLALKAVAGDPHALTTFLDWIERVEARGRKGSGRGK
jgi:hypothetical protein